MAGYLHFTRARHVDFHPLRLQRQRSDQPGVVCIARPGKGLRAMCAAKNPKSSNGGLWADTGNVIRKIYTDPDISNGRIRHLQSIRSTASGIEVMPASGQNIKERDHG